MSDERAIDEEAVFSAAIAIDEAGKQLAYLRQACGGDTALLARVEALLRVHASKTSFIERVADSLQLTIDVPLMVEGPGTVIDRYKLLEKIGEGGMAVVYMAEQQEPIHRKVALKIIKLGMDTRQVIARFEAERQALALMDHPSIAKVLDAGATETGRPYFVMELVTGVSITEYCDKNNLSTKDRLALFLQVCHAVQHAHQKGIIHRDLKPSNVMVTHHDGQPIPKVIDFGIAKATNQRLTEKTLFTRYAHIIGTPAYMSPEQAELSDLDVDTRSDIYSLGVLLYELLTGTTPFSEEDLRKAGYIEMQRVIREEEPAKPSTRLSSLGETLTDVAKRRSSTPDLLRKAIRGELDWIVMKALEKDRTRRYDSSSALLADVKRYLDREPVLAGPPTAWYRTRKFVQRHGALVTVVVFVAATVVVGLGISMALYLRAERARDGEAVARAETQAVTDFLTKDLLASVYPEKARNQEVTVRYILESAARDLDEKFANSPLAEAQVRETLGRTYQKMGDYEAAKPHLERAWEIRREQFGEEHPATLASLNLLGMLYSNWGRYEQAEPLLARALDLRRRVLGEEHPDTLESMSDLAWQYMCEARFEEGMVLATRALERGRRVLGEEDPIVLRAMNALAAGYVTVMRYAEAQSLAGQGYEISRRVLGEEHETTLLLANVLAWACESGGRPDAAAELAARTVEIGRRIVGEEHLITIWAMSNLGAAYLKQGRREEAAPLLTRAFELAAQVGGPDHAGTVLFGLRLAILYRVQERWAEHEALLIQLAEASRRTHGEEHPQTGYIKYWLQMRIEQLTSVYREQEKSGDSQGAATTFGRLEELRRAYTGDSETQKSKVEGPR
ncbi:MAG: serine/threonine-protein kinase [Phycisphaerae bacterium]|nr:serine/threonine-protein kinase [Phycisphaerae bacterium]